MGSVTMQQDSTDPTGVVATNNAPEVTTARQRKAAAAVQLRRDHVPWEEIAEILGYPTARAALVATENALKTELRTTEGREFMVRLATERLDELTKAVWKKALDDSHPDHLAYHDRARMTVNDWIKLHGLQAPSTHILANPSQGEIERVVGKLLAVAQPALEEDDIFEIEEVGD